MAASPARWADLRFLLGRLTGLARRARASLRTRGWRATLERVQAHLRARPASTGSTLYAPSNAPFEPFALATSTTPTASIVIPVFNEIDHTLACLRALAEHPPALPVEVIVVDDGSSDATAELLPRLDGLLLLRRSTNGGFVAACNDGAGLARGEFLVFLNNDTVPQPGWLEALLSTFETHPDTGLAGAQLIYPDGRLQESGGFVFSDASGWNYGRFGNPGDPRYAFVRETDYCSGAAIAIRRELFEDAGRFDTRYAPAYYEDTDLAFAVRQRGLKVRVQPAARVVHHEGATAGTDPMRGAKAYQVRNQRVFADKWKARLTTCPDSGTDPDVAAMRGRTGVLIVDEHAPDPSRDSASLRLVNMMALLQQEGAHVAFAATGPERNGDAFAALRQAGVEAWSASELGSPTAWLRRHGVRFSTFVLCRHHVAHGLEPLIRRQLPHARIVFDTVDLHYVRERRGAEVAGDPAAMRDADRTRELEHGVVRRADATLVVSEAERSLLARAVPDAKIHVLSNLHRVAGAGRSFAERHGVVFVGGFRHPPNADAVIWFVESVWPLVSSRRSDLEFHCIGADAPAAIRAFASAPGVHLHGHVPDIRPWMDGARVCVAPLRFGAGVKGKVNLSMAHGQPVVATSCAVEGMHLRDGEDVLVADDPQGFADAILRLYEDEALWNRLAANGLDNVARHFSMDAARETVRRVILQRDA